MLRPHMGTGISPHGGCRVRFPILGGGEDKRSLKVKFAGFCCIFIKKSHHLSGGGVTEYPTNVTEVLMW